MSNIRYRPELDGLRAVAVIAVILFHAGLGCPGGYVGVDVFFVISGFLITSLIVKELDAGTFTLADFWGRRIRRIVPALAVLVAVVLLVGYFLLLPNDLQGLGESGLAQSFLAANVYFWRDTSYFAPAAESKLLLHTWSLAVEEQFYLGFPLLMIWLAKWKFSRGRVMSVLFFLALASFALGVYGSSRHPAASFYLLPTRAWELLAGSLVALLPVHWRLPRIANELLAWVGVLLLIVAILLYDRSMVFPGIGATVPVLGAAAIIWANASQRTKVGTLLASKPLVWIGLFSYSLYLWHWPAISYWRYVLDAESRQGIITLTVVLVCAIAWLSWKYIEEPIRKRQVLASPYALGTALGIAFLGTIAAECSLVANHGFPDRLPRKSQLPTKGSWATLAMFRDGRPHLLGSGAHIAQPAFIVWGDSHAHVGIDVFDEVAKQYGLTGIDATKSGYPPILGASLPWANDLPRWNSYVLDFVKTRRIPNVFLSARWSTYVEGYPEYDVITGRGSRLPLVFSDSFQGNRNRDASYRCFTQGISQLIDALLNLDCTVWIVKQVPDQDHDVLRDYHLRQRGLSISRRKQHVTLASFLSRQRRVDEFFREIEQDRVHIVEVHDRLFDTAGQPILETDGVPLYYDCNHLSVHGVDVVLRPIIVDALEHVAQAVNE